MRSTVPFKNSLYLKTPLFRLTKFVQPLPSDPGDLSLRRGWNIFTSRLEGVPILVTHIFVAEQVEASWAPGHNKGVPCWSSFSPQRKRWIAWHTARSQRCHSRRRLRSSSPNFNSAKRSRRWKGKTFSHPGAWHLQLHGRNLAVRATLLKVQASCKLISQVSLHRRQKKRARKVFLSRKHQHENVNPQLRPHGEKNVQGACVSLSKWKAMLLHARGRSCIMRRCERRWLEFFKLRHRYRCIGLTMSCVKMLVRRPTSGFEKSVDIVGWTNAFGMNRQENLLWVQSCC